MIELSALWKEYDSDTESFLNSTSSDLATLSIVFLVGIMVACGSIKSGTALY